MNYNWLKYVKNYEKMYIERQYRCLCIIISYDFIADNKTNMKNVQKARYLRQVGLRVVPRPYSFSSQDVNECIASKRCIRKPQS